MRGCRSECEEGVQELPFGAQDGGGDVGGVQESGQRAGVMGVLMAGG